MIFGRSIRIIFGRSIFGRSGRSIFGHSSRIIVWLYEVPICGPCHAAQLNHGTVARRRHVRHRVLLVCRGRP